MHNPGGPAGGEGGWGGALKGSLGRGVPLKPRRRQGTRYNMMLSRFILYTESGNFQTNIRTKMYMLWFNFILGLNFMFLCFWVW